MKKTILAVSVVLAALLTAGGAAAYHFQIWEENELKDSFCSKMDDRALYDEMKVTNYATLIPGRDGWIFRTGNDFRTNWALKDQTVTYLTELRDSLKRQNVDIIYVMPPIRGLVHADELFRRHKAKYQPDPDLAWSNYESMLEALRKKGLYVAGVSPEQVTPDFFYKRDHHWTATGARITAENVAAVARTLPAYAQIPKMEFESVEKEPVEYDSSFGKAFRKLCDTGVPTEVIKPYETVPKGGSTDQAALFDESGNDPRFILLGTSNSVQETSQANFEGFLKESLSADVLNLSYVGAGIDTSIMTFVNSKRMRDGQPKIVLWEIPGYYDLNNMDDKLFNQLIPAVYGSCAGNSIQSTHVVLKEGSNRLADLKKTSGQIPSYVHLSFTEPVTNKFSLNFQFSTSGAKKQQFDRFDGYKADGEFYTLFPGGVDPLQWRNVSLQAPAALEGKEVNVEICGDQHTHAQAVIPASADPPTMPETATEIRTGVAPAESVPETDGESQKQAEQQEGTSVTTPETEEKGAQQAAGQPQPSSEPAATEPETVTPEPSPEVEASAPPDEESYIQGQKDTLMAKSGETSPDNSKTGAQWVIKTP